MIPENTNEMPLLVNGLEIEAILENHATHTDNIMNSWKFEITDSIMYLWIFKVIDSIVYL